MTIETTGKTIGRINSTKATTRTTRTTSEARILVDLRLKRRKLLAGLEMRKTPHFRPSNLTNRNPRRRRSLEKATETTSETRTRRTPGTLSPPSTSRQPLLLRSSGTLLESLSCHPRPHDPSSASLHVRDRHDHRL